MKKTDINTIIESPTIEELGKKNVTTLPKDFSDNQRIAIAKAVFYIISADEFSYEESQFFFQLCTDLKVDNIIMDKIAAMSNDSMFDALKTISDEQEAFLLAFLNNAAYADNILVEEVKIIKTFITQIRKGGKPKDFYTKIQTS